MPTARFWLGAAVVNNSSGQPIVYAVGGSDGHLDPLRRVEAYNYATNSWTRKADLPYVGAGSGRLAVAMDGKIYVPGGAPDGRRLYVYDPGTGTWGSKALMPIPVGSGMSAAIDGKLYVFIGSWYPYEDSSRARRLYRYDPGTNTWSRRANSPDYHAEGIAAAIGGKLYLMGGYDESGIRPEEEYLWPSHLVSVYDPATNRWTTHTGGSRGDHCSAGAAFQSKVWDLGGRGFAPDIDIDATVKAYDPATDALVWKAPMLTPRCGAAAVKVVYGGVARLLVLGGYNNVVEQWDALRTVERYTP